MTNDMSKAVQFDSYGGIDEGLAVWTSPGGDNGQDPGHHRHHPDRALQ
jgi:hypothetical protein